MDGGGPRVGRGGGEEGGDRVVEGGRRAMVWRGGRLTPGPLLGRFFVDLVELHLINDLSKMEFKKFPRCLSHPQVCPTLCE